MKVLIVSDSEAARGWVRDALGPAWTFREAANGVEGLKRARIGGFDLVVTDETAIPYGAFGLTRELKWLPDPPAVLILLERAQDVWLARWSGADRWLLRPVDPFEVAQTATALVEALGPRERPDDRGGEPSPERTEPVAG